MPHLLNAPNVLFRHHPPIPDPDSFLNMEDLTKSITGINHGGLVRGVPGIDLKVKGDGYALFGYDQTPVSLFAIPSMVPRITLCRFGAPLTLKVGGDVFEECSDPPFEGISLFCHISISLWSDFNAPSR